MNEEIIKLFEVNTDAIATNRGFYYQYLVVLKKWITNYIEDTNLTTLTEVEDDIKEIGDEIIFTQVKCYTSSFSLNSKEIRKSLFNFFILYSKYKNFKEKISFCFSTNTQISKREKLLTKWAQNENLEDKELLTLCVKKVKEILIKEVKERKNKLLQRGTSETDKEVIKIFSNSFKNSLEADSIEPFVKSIFWDFNGLSPEKGVDFFTNEIQKLLEHKKFDNKPPSLLFRVLLSEIYRSSQKDNKSERVLDNAHLTTIIKHTEDDLLQLVDIKLTKLFKIELESLKADVANLMKTSDLHSKDISSLKIELKKTAVKTPKHLNLLPDFSSIDIFGWDDFLNQVHSVLSKKKTISIYSEGGMGKTTFGKKYLKTFDNYDHIIWVNVENSFSTSLLLDDVLRTNLKFTASTESESIDSTFKNLLNTLNKIEGENLIIIDIQESEKELAEIKSLSLSPNWHKLIFTRSHLKTLPNNKLPVLSFKVTKEIYLSHCYREKANDRLLKEFFEAVDYNILIIELVSKTIESSIDLSLKDFVTSLKEQELDKDDFKIDIEINDKDDSIRIFNYLIERFSLPKLKSIERNYLEYLSILPSNNIVIEDLILINGLKDYNENKITIINIVNSLDKKGLINISEDKKRIDIHKIIRETIIYNQRSQQSPFISSMFYIAWLTSRIKEGYNAPMNSFRYLKYAESIINSIKEQYRSSVYQPLLLLENEYFYSIRFYLGAKNELPKLISLAKRAEKYPPLNKSELGVIYNNLALCYSENNEKKLAIGYFQKALKLYPIKGKEFLRLTITTLNNLSTIYLMDNDLINAMKNFKKVQTIREMHSLYDDQQLSIEYRILSRSYAIAGSFKEAINLLKSGIKLHKSLNPLDRNDFYLAAYHNELSSLYLITNKIDEAVENQEVGIQILENMSLYNSAYLLTMYKISQSLYKYLGLKTKENEIEEKINLFKAYQS